MEKLFRFIIFTKKKHPGNELENEFDMFSLLENTQEPR